jgi:hypothetical protein
MIGARAMPGQAVRVVRLMVINACALKKPDSRSWNAPA